MERTKLVDDQTVPVFRWKVVSKSGFHGLNHRIYKPGEIFTATEVEVPLAFRDVIVKVDVASVQEQKKPISGVSPVYSTQQVEGQENQWNVVDQKGKVINEKPLTLPKAQKLVKDLAE